MNQEQRFAFDTWGFLVVDDAITAAHVAALKTGAEDKGPSLHSQLGRDGGFWSQAYFDLLDVPTIFPILEEIYGGTLPSGLPPFRIDHINPCYSR